MGWGGAHLAKVHTLDTFTTQGWTNRGTGTGLTSPDDELDELFLSKCVLSHDGGRMWMFMGKKIAKLGGEQESRDFR